MKNPQKNGPAIELFPRVRDRYTAVQQCFYDPEAGTKYEYTLFDSKDKPSMVLPVTRTGHVVAIRQFRHGANEIVIELPGGCANHINECPKEVALRELREETGHTGTIISLHRDIWIDPCVCTVAFSSFLALNCEKVQEPCLDPWEQIHVMHIPLQEWIHLACVSIKDSKTMAVTLAALPYLARTFPIAEYITAIGTFLGK